MQEFQLRINIDPEWVSQIVQAGQNVVITKQVAGNSGTSVAWVSFSPYPSNSVAWDDSYAVFTSKITLQSGATITRVADIQAAPQNAYGFKNNVFGITTPYTALGPGQYEAVNQSGMTSVLGLAQDVTVNGLQHELAPIFAATVLPGQWLDMTPYDTVSVFLQANVRSAMCLGTVTGPTCQVTFGGGLKTQTIEFVPSLGGFHIMPSQS